ncbi:hypothetical protein ACP70R_015734 [Stipagrostis hirtigluma subsp. patula]
MADGFVFFRPPATGLSPPPSGAKLGMSSRPADPLCFLGPDLDVGFLVRLQKPVGFASPDGGGLSAGFLVDGCEQWWRGSPARRTPAW